MTEWKFDRKQQHQHTIRLCKETCKMIDAAFDNITNMNRFIEAAIRHFCTCPLGEKVNGSSGYETQLKIIEMRLTNLEHEITGYS